MDVKADTNVDVKISAEINIKSDVKIQTKINSYNSKQLHTILESQLIILPTTLTKLITDYNIPNKG